VPEVALEPDTLGKILQRLGERYGQRLWRLQVGEVEVVAMIRQGGTIIPIRFFASNPTGYHFRVDGYIEVREQEADRTLARLASLHPRRESPLSGREVGEPYAVTDRLEQRRLIARQNQTTYVYDFLELFAEALRQEWQDHLQAKRLHKVDISSDQVPRDFIKSIELLPDTNDEGLREAEKARGIGKNTIGIVAWKVVLFSPEYPDGREVVLIGNDITHQSGSFGPQEDFFFYHVSRYARARGLPRIYLAANSGARIGLAQEVKEKFRVAWMDPKDPTKGFRYLFLSDEDYKPLSPYVNAQRVGFSIFRLFVHHLIAFSCIDR
jgi:acetyl-CoA carboxylase/biotin carboxylase 1